VIRADKIKIIDNHIKWSFTFYNNKTVTLSSFEELTLFLLNEAKYWKKYENNFTDNSSSYSDWYNKCNVALNEVINKIEDDKETATSLFNLIQTQLNNVKITNVSQSQASRAITVVIRCPNILCSNNTNHEAIAYAYSNFFNDNKPVYDAFISIVENQAAINDLLSSRSNMDNQKAVIAYFGFQLKTNKYPSYDLLNKEKIKSIENDIDNIANNLQEKRNDINEFIDNCREQYDKQYSERNNEIDEYRNAVNSWYEKSIEKVNSLEETYKEKLHLAEPVAHWEKEAKKKHKSFLIWLSVTVLMCVTLLFVATRLVTIVLLQAEIISDLLEGSPLYFVPQYFIFVAIISFLVYIIRIFIKITMSEKHMHAEYSQKAAFTYFYLSLLQSSDDGISKEERPIILNALFSGVDTGLIKSESKSETDIAILASLLNK